MKKSFVVIVLVIIAIFVMRYYARSGLYNCELPIADFACSDGNAVISIAFSPDERYLAAGTAVRWWNTITQSVNEVVGAVWLWDLDNGSLVAMIECKGYAPTALAFDSNILFVGGGTWAAGQSGNQSDRMSPIWSRHGRIVALTYPRLDEKSSKDLDCGVYGLVRSKSGNLLAATGASGADSVNLKIVSAEDLSDLASHHFDGNGLPFGDFGPVRPMVFTHDERFLYACFANSGAQDNLVVDENATSPNDLTWQNQIVSIDTSSFQEGGRVTLKGPPIQYLDVASDSGTLLCGFLHGTVRAKIVTAEGKAEIVGDPLPYPACDFLGEAGQIIACVEHQRTSWAGIRRSLAVLRIDDHFAAELVKCFDIDKSSPELPIRSFAVSSHNRMVAVGCDLGAIYVWSLGQ